MRGSRDQRAEGRGQNPLTRTLPHPLTLPSPPRGRGKEGRAQGFAFLLGLCLLLGFFLAFLEGPALAQEAKLADPALEAEALSLMREIRCVVCEAQSIAESDAAIAADLRRIIREKIKAGEDRSAIEAYLVQRYGDFILFRPPFKAATLLLWAGPFLLLSLGAFIVFRLLRRRS